MAMLELPCRQTPLLPVQANNLGVPANVVSGENGARWGLLLIKYDKIDSRQVSKHEERNLKVSDLKN